jgi:uncharacterized protein (DUF58 family)
VPERILSSADYELVKALSLGTRRRVSGFAAGEQRSPARGGGIEFADYREYMPGDDVRLVDWAVYLRLRKLLVRLCAEEKELTLALVLDASRSMDSGSPGKLMSARRVSAILAGIALRNGNRVGVCALGGELSETLKPERSRVGLEEAEAALSRIRAEDSFLPVAGMRRFASRYGGKCVAVLLSDFLYPEWRDVLSSLAASGSESYAVQILSPEELDPGLSGEITLVDSENDEEVPLVIGAGTARDYASAARSFMDSVARRARELGIGWASMGSDEPMERFFRRDLAGSGIVC